MRPIIKTSVIVITILTLLSCGTSVKRTLSDTSIPVREIIYDNASMVVYTDDHTRTRRNADKIFLSWVDSKGMRRHVTGKRLLAIGPRQDGCHLTYDFRMIDGTEQRITLIVPEYNQQYRKRHRQTNAAVVNGKKYNFRH